MKNQELIGNYFSYSPINVTYKNYFSSNPMCTTEEGISFIRLFNDTIYQYNSSQFSAKYLIQTPQKTPPLSAIDPTPASYHESKNKIKDKGYFTGFDKIFETPNHLLLGFTENNGIPHYFFADKRKKQGSYYMLVFSSQKDEIPFFPILACHENYFISVAEPRHLLFRKDEFDQNDEIGKKFQTMLENLDEQDNPVLFFYEFD
ncbi:MAG: hypothetical protein LIO65_02905 [Odoribacter sp.]|nr:hypothetical protein [Odoribacter sp.]